MTGFCIFFTVILKRQQKFIKMSKRKPQVEEEKDRLTRIAIVSNDKCKPKKCRQECKRSCPVVRMGKLL